MHLTTTPRSPKATNSILGCARGFILATGIVLAGLCLAGPALADMTGTTGGMTISDNGTAVTITGYTADLPANVTVPATINGHPVTAIGDSAFEESSLTTISLPNSITSIADDAFYKARSLTSIVIPNSVTSIGTDAFSYTDSLTSVTIGTGVTEISDSMFAHTPLLTSITIPNSVTSIDGDAFNQTGLTSVVIPNSVTYIGEGAFYKAAGLASVTLSTNPNFTSIDDSVFLESGLTSLTIPDNVTSIGFKAFESTQLTTVTIGSGVTFITSNAFARLPLTSVRFEGNAPVLGEDAIWYTDRITAYRFANATGWPAFDQTWQGMHQAYLLLPPAAPTALASNTSATITIAAPPTHGPAPTSYTVKAVSNPDKTCEITGPTGSCTITGLTNGTSYTFTAATHTTTPAVTSDESEPSNQVTPAAAPTPPTPTAPTLLHLVSKPATTTSTITTTFDAPGPGVVRQTGTSPSARSHLRATGMTVCTTTKTVTKAGTTTITCRLTNAAKRARTQHALVVTLTTTFTPTTGTPLASTKTIRLARTPAKAHTPTTTPSHVTG